MNLLVNRTRHVSKRSLSASAFRIAVSAVVFLAWVGATNHCALGLPMGAAKDASATASAAPVAGHENCPGHSDSGEKKDGGSPGSCCKSLQAPVALAKPGASYDSTFFALHVYFAGAFTFSDVWAANLSPLGLDTGPPGAVSFAESVLQRSILAHAPPFVA